MIDIDAIINSPANNGPVIPNLPTTTLPPDVKAVVTAILSRCFRNAREFDHIMRKQGWRDQDGELQRYSHDETATLDVLAEAFEIDPLDVSHPIVAKENGWS